MKPLVLGVIQDLRERRLLPVAVLLAAALIVVPVLMLKPAEQAVAPAATPATPAAANNGLPSPEAALAAGDRPLVTLAVLDKPSDLRSFDSKNPFKPLQAIDGGGLPDSVKSGSGATVASTGGGGGDTGGSGGGGGGDTGGSPPSGQPVPSPESGQPAEPKKFTYTVDLTFEGPKGVRRYRNLPRLRMLPSDSNPLLVFLGIDAAGEKAVFLVDSTVKMLDGEGSCSPNKAGCATLSMEPGERQAFTDDGGERYEIQIDQIRELSLASVARAAARKAAREDDDRPAAKAAVGSARRFVPPVLAELFTEAVQR